MVGVVKVVNDVGAMASATIKIPHALPTCRLIVVMAIVANRVLTVAVVVVVALAINQLAVLNRNRVIPTLMRLEKAVAKTRRCAVCRNNYELESLRTREEIGGT